MWREGGKDRERKSGGGGGHNLNMFIMLAKLLIGFIPCTCTCGVARLAST